MRPTLFRVSILIIALYLGTGALYLGQIMAQEADSAASGGIPITADNAANVTQVAVMYGDLRGHLDWIGGISFSPDGQHLAFVSNNIVYLWNIQPTRLIADFGALGHPDHSEALFGRAVAFSPDGILLASGWGTGGRGEIHVDGIWVWNIATGRTVTVIDSIIGDVLSLAFSPDGQTLVSGVEGGSGNRIMQFWNPTTGEELFPIDETVRGSYVVFSADGSLLAVAVTSESVDHSITLWDWDSGERILSIPDTANVTNIDLSRDGSLLAAVTTSGYIMIWDVLTGERLQNIDAHLRQGILSVAFSSNASVVISTSGDRAAQEIEQEALTLKLWNRNTGELLKVLEGHTGGYGIRTLDVSPDGSLIASAGADATVRLWGVVACTVTASGTPNLRSGPGTNYGFAGSFADLPARGVTGQAIGTDNMVWYQFWTGEWVRSDIINAPEECQNAPTIDVDGSSDGD